MSNVPRDIAKQVHQTQAETTPCCIVGAGPGGAILALLLARRGVPVTLLEIHKDFDRDFRGNTIHPSVLEILDQIGLADRLHQLPHSKGNGLTVEFPSGPFRMFDLSRLKTRYRYTLIIPPARFLDFITREAAKYPQFELLMRAQVRQLVEENGVVRGVRYHEDSR
jgi:2-polyprenyl-6-methoxyphenol hydroxylase-like FAD-dependent oxidoreductase